MATYTMKQAKPAPSSSNGLVFWLRENLFPDIKNSLLTLVWIVFNLPRTASFVRLDDLRCHLEWYTG